MPVSADVRERLRSHLDPDDEIRYVFPADILMSAKPSVFVVVSRKPITVFSTSFRSRKVPRSILTQFPRMTVLGPLDTASTPHFTTAGITYEIDDESVAEIQLTQDFPGDRLPILWGTIEAQVPASENSTYIAFGQAQRMDAGGMIKTVTYPLSSDKPEIACKHAVSIGLQKQSTLQCRT